MRKYTYFAVFEPNGSGGYGVYFPDLPGCVSIGDDFDHAWDTAEEALGLHLYCMERDGNEIPVSSIYENLEINSEPIAGYAILPIIIYPDIVKNILESVSQE